jgi:hypothetical protein
MKGVGFPYILIALFFAVIMAGQNIHSSLPGYEKPEVEQQFQRWQ